MALANNKIIRTAGSFTTPGNGLMTNPNAPAIGLRSGHPGNGRAVRRARRGSGLVATSTRSWTATQCWASTRTSSNNARQNVGAAPARCSTQNTGAYNATLSKTFANGGPVVLEQHVELPQRQRAGLCCFRRRIPVSCKRRYTQPLWAGSGVEFTRIAGAVEQRVRGVTGVSQGVVIARINEDIAWAPSSFRP